MLLGADHTIVFIGDSITDAGHTDRAPYGDGYVNIIEMLLTACYPAWRLRVINRGVAGNTVRDLHDRWERDALAEHPDWLSIMIGINDVWRAFGANPHESVPLPEYEATLRDLMAQARDHGVQMIVMTPYLIEPDRRDIMRRQVDLYGDAVRRVAADHAALCVDTQAAFDAVLQHSTPSHWSGDRVHPSTNGHAVIARAWLQAVGFTWT